MSNASRLFFVVSALACAALFVPDSALADAPSRVPVQGYLTDADGVPLDGEAQLTLTLYDASGGTLFSQTSTVQLAAGAFTVFLGDASNPVSLSTFRDHETLELGIAVDGGSEMLPRFAIATAPFAAFAQFTNEAASLGGLTADDFARAGAVDWTELVNVPADLADGAVDWTELVNVPADLGDGAVDWSEVANVPAGLADGADNDTLAALTCNAGESASWDGAAWACTAPLTDFGGLTNVPADLADGDDDTLAGLSCAQGEVASATLTRPGWGCAANPTYVAGAGLEMSPWISGTRISVVDGGITSAMIADATITAADIGDGAVGTAQIADGSILTGDIRDGAVNTADIWNGTILAEDLSTMGCTASQILKQSGTGWICVADDNTLFTAGTGLSLTGTTFSLASHDHDAANITTGTLATARYDAYADLSDAGRLDNNSASDLLTRGQMDGRYLPLSVYNQSDTNQINCESRIDVIASCLDANDIIIAHECTTNNAARTRFEEFDISNMLNSLPANVRCQFHNEALCLTGGPADITAEVYCLAIP